MEKIQLDCLQTSPSTASSTCQTAIFFYIKKHFNEKISNCKISKALFSVASEMKQKGITNRNPLQINTPAKDLPDVFGEFLHTNVSEIREPFNNVSDSDSHVLNEVCLTNNEISNFNAFRDASSDPRHLSLALSTHFQPLSYSSALTL